jgi:hypothetical protein
MRLKPRESRDFHEFRKFSKSEVAESLGGEPVAEFELLLVYFQ